MLFISTLTVTFFLGTAAGVPEEERMSAPRLRSPDASAHHVSSISEMFPTYGKFFKSVSEADPLQLAALIHQAKQDASAVEEKDQFDAVMEAFASLSDDFSMSMSPVPTDVVTPAPTSPPTDPADPSPATLAPVVPSDTAAPTNSPTVPVDADAASPDASPAPDTTTDSPTASPVDTAAPADGTPGFEGGVATPAPSPAPTNPPTDPAPVTPAPTQAPTLAPTQGPTPTLAPTLSNCPGITPEERVAMILAILDAVADPVKIRDATLPQGLATAWILAQDAMELCPTHDKLIQRWALAVLYFSTGGEEWFQCSANANTGDNCGNEDPFVLGQERFLSGSGECEWAGITCNSDECVTEIEFGTFRWVGLVASFSPHTSNDHSTEENNLRGTIPSEISLLTDLMIWGMERGHLASTIPTEVGRLTNLIFIDLDYNELTGTLSSELLSLSRLVQLDLNNNQLSGNLDGIEQYPNMEFLQLHDNLFTGTVPDAVGSYTSLAAFTLHESMISGTMPDSVCNLLASAGNGGSLTSLIADCSLPNPNIVCTCCTDCRTPL